MSWDVTGDGSGERHGEDLTEPRPTVDRPRWETIRHRGANSGPWMGERQVAGWMEVREASRPEWYVSSVLSQAAS